ncbi:BRO family protein [Neisseria elongata]
MNAPVQQFNPSQIAITDHNGGKWLTAEQLGLALGFSGNRARAGVNNLYNRHIDEFTEKDSCVIKLMTQGQGRETRIFSHSGCNLLSFFANTPNAKAFRAWAKVRLAEPAAPSAGGRINAEQAAVLRGMAADLSERSGEPPQSVYARFFRAFAVRQTADLPRAAYAEACTFLSRPAAPAPWQPQLTAEEVGYLQQSPDARLQNIALRNRHLIPAQLPQEVQP